MSQGGADIPNETGSYDFGNVSLLSRGNATFRIQNTGIPDLVLTGSPEVQISGADASYFSVSAQPTLLQLGACQSTLFKIQFTPTDAQTRNATVSIMNNDGDRNPYTFTISGTGSATELTLNTWMEGNVSTYNEEKTYCFVTIPGKAYGISWIDAISGSYSAPVKVSAYRQDLSTTYFNDDILTGPRFITAQDNIVYVKVTGLYAGLYAIKAFLEESAMNLKQGTTAIPRGGNYDCGNVALGPGNSVTFTIENTGSGNLNLTDTPKVRINGTDAASFRVSTDPPATIGANESATFNISCEPTIIGIKTATVSIANNDPAGGPYTFTITGTGTVEGTLGLDTWTTGNISPGERKTYCLNVTSGRTYAITWDDSGNGSGAYTGDVLVSAHRQDFTASYFLSRNNGFGSNQAVISAQDNYVYSTVIGNDSSSTGSFALKAYIYEPVMNVQDGRNTLIPNGTGSYDFGDVSLCVWRDGYFSIVNNGNASLDLTTYPCIQISGPDASQFRVTNNPFPNISPSEGSSFHLEFTPTSTGPKTATVTITNNDPDQNPYTFTVTGNGTGSFIPVTLDNWNSGSISSTINLYSFNATPGTAYAIRWDDGYKGSGTYSGHVKVSAFREDKITTYFNDIYYGYTNPQVIIAQDDIVYIRVAPYSGTCTGTYGLLVSLSEPVINVKQGTTSIPNGTGSNNYGPVTINTYDSAYFTVENTGDGALHLTDNPPVQITGPDVSSFNIGIQPASTINIRNSSNLYVRFTPASTGIKTATVSIGSDDADQNPYTFTITGYGAPVIEKALTFGSWTEGNIATAGEEKYYSFNATSGKKYAIVWDDSGQGSGNYTGDVKVTAYRADFLTPYFAGINNGYTLPQFVTAQDTTIYIKVTGLDSSSTGSFNLKITESVINVKEGSINIPNGSGSYDFGSVALDSSNSVTFTVQNIGSVNLNLTGSPKVQISGVDASCFRVSTQPSSPVWPGNSTTFTLQFTPSGVGTKTATVSIGNDDPYSSPYIFTVTGTVNATNISLDTWTPGSISSAGQVKTYYFHTTPGTIYAIAWDDSSQGSGTYTGDIKVTAFRQDYATAYFSSANSGYTPCRTITAQDSIVYLKVAGYDASSTGSFALKPSLSIPVINLKQGSANIQNRTGNYDFGNVSIGLNSSVTFTIQNTGTGNLNLNGSPKVEISGVDASLFSVTTEPASPVAISGSTTFTVCFTPTTLGSKTATISIVSDDTTNSPYVFTITGTGTATGIPLTLGVWTSGNLATAGEVKTYYFMTTPGTVYTISWDDSYNGSSTYTGNIKVSGYRQDLTTAYFSNIDSGWTYPLTITAQDIVVYIKVAGFSSSSTGSFALKPSLNIPVINVKQGSTNIPNTTGIYNYGNVAPGTNSSIQFTIQNNGNGSLNLTGSPKVQISGTDAALFSVTSQPYSPLGANSSTTFMLQFAPTSLGTKTATVSILSNDPDNSTYTFTVTGAGANAGEELTPGTYIPKNLATAGETKTYWFTTTPGKTYKIYWDDSYQGSGTYTCDIKVSGYWQNLTTTYFSNIDSGYTTPQTITAQESIVYLKVSGYSSSNTGNFALKIVQAN